MISAARWGPDGPDGPFEVVLRHEVHLSYPFVVEHHGEVWMVPETSAAHLELSLDSGPIFHAGDVKVSGLKRYPSSIVENFDPHIRGFRYGQIYSIADGIWFPVRTDLDSMLTKIDPSLISGIDVIAGPYGVRYGPAFGFIDVRLAPSPRPPRRRLRCHHDRERVGRRLSPDGRRL